MRSLRVVGLALLPLAAPYGLQEMLKGNDPSKADLETWKGQYLSPEMGGQVDKAFEKHRGDILSTKAQLYKGFQSLSADIQGKSGEANAQLLATLGSGPAGARDDRSRRAPRKSARSRTPTRSRGGERFRRAPTCPPSTPGLTADEQLNAISKGGVKEGGDPLAAAEPLIEQRERLYRTQREQKLAAQRGSAAAAAAGRRRPTTRSTTRWSTSSPTSARRRGPARRRGVEGERISAAIIADRRQAAKIHMASKESDELEPRGRRRARPRPPHRVDRADRARRAGGRSERCVCVRCLCKRCSAIPGCAMSALSPFAPPPPAAPSPPLLPLPWVMAVIWVDLSSSSSAV